jgi:conjugal transfer pilus assembly protein TraW
MARGAAAAAVIGLAIAAFGSSAVAGDLGAYGATFKVREVDLFDMLRAKLAVAQKSGKIEALNKAFVARVRKRLDRPEPVAGLTRAVTQRSWLYDPTFVVPQNFADNKGRVFAHAGDRINPLDRLPSFQRVLVFVDGDDQEQVGFAIRRYRANPNQVRIVLTKGAPIQLMQKEKVELYFDQSGTLTQKFGFSHTPAVVEKDGRALRITEVKL